MAIQSIFSKANKNKENQDRNTFPTTQSLPLPTYEPPHTKTKKPAVFDSHVYNWPAYISSEETLQSGEKEEDEPLSYDDLRLLNELVDIPINAEYYISRDKARCGVAETRPSHSSQDEAYSDTFSQFTTFVGKQDDFDY